MYFIMVCSEIRRYEKSAIQRVEVSRNKIFDHIIVINHRFLKNYK